MKVRRYYIACRRLKQYVKQYPGQEVYVIGGEEVYHLLLPYCDTAYITKVHRENIRQMLISEFR